MWFGYCCDDGVLVSVYMFICVMLVCLSMCVYLVSVVFVVIMLFSIVMWDGSVVCGVIVKVLCILWWCDGVFSLFCVVVECVCSSRLWCSDMLNVWVSGWVSFSVWL